MCVVVLQSRLLLLLLLLHLFLLLSTLTVAPLVEQNSEASLCVAPVRPLLLAAPAVLLLFLLFFLSFSNIAPSSTLYSVMFS